MIVHTNIEKHAIFYTIMHGPQICTINKRLVLILVCWLYSLGSRVAAVSLKQSSVFLTSRFYII